MTSKKPHHHRAEEARRSPSPTSWGGARKAVLALVLLLASPVHADPAKDEARAEALFQEVRCVVCQSESIADSDAEIAADMRRDIRAQIAAGVSDADIRKHLYARYGDYVLFRPRVSPANMLLWGLPPLIVALGAGAFLVMAKRTRKSETYDLSAEEDRKLRDIMNNPD